MTSSLKGYKVRLISAVHDAESSADIQTLALAAIQFLKSNGMKSQSMATYVQEIIHALTSSVTSDQTNKKWENVQLAKIYFVRIKRELLSANL